MREQIAEHLRVVEAATGQVAALESMADRAIACFEGGGRIYTLGNGGSAADAQHIAAELVGRFKRNRKPLPAVALTTDTSTLTAIMNDVGVDDVFARQVRAHVTRRDIVWALSVSGTSPNVIAALAAARAIGCTIFGFSGRTGGKLKEFCDLCFLADHDVSDRVQEMHLLAYHLVCDRIERHFAE